MNIELASKKHISERGVYSMNYGLFLPKFLNKTHRRQIFGAGNYRDLVISFPTSFELYQEWGKYRKFNISFRLLGFGLYFYFYNRGN